MNVAEVVQINPSYIKNLLLKDNYIFLIIFLGTNCKAVLENEVQTFSQQNMGGDVGGGVALDCVSLGLNRKYAL